MKRTAVAVWTAWVLLAAAAAPLQAREDLPGTDVESLLAIAREANPEYAAMRREAAAASERIYPAGALPDPKFRMELRDITNMGETNPTLSPSRVGSTSYLLMQDVPWFGKRGLRREVAEFEARGADGRAQWTWAELSARIKSAYAQLYYVHRNERLTREILDLVVRLEQVAQVRYASGLAAQQDVIRAQVEQTAMHTELVALENERRQWEARLNGLLARPKTAALAEPQRLRPLPPPAALDYAGLEARARARNPLLFAEEARQRAAEKSRDLTYRNRYPDFTFGVTPIQSRNSVREWELMVEVNIPLQQETRRAQERESEAMLEAARDRREAAANQVLAELAENLAAVAAARRTEDLAAGSFLPQAETTFQAALAGYETGKVDFATLLDAQRQIRQARQNQLKAQADGRMALAEIERLLGEDL